MRLFSSLVLPLAATAALLAPFTPAHAAPTQAAPACDAPDPGAFPLATRIHGGPAAYAPGGGYGTWYLDLTNTTTRTCTDIHPVVVLVDKEHALKAAQPRLEFYDRGRPRPVRLESTDEDELVGAFGGAGLTVGPGRTVTVKVRLALTSDAVPNQVTVNAAVVQRHNDDGDWVGQSNDYRFAVADDTDTGSDTDTDTGVDIGTDAEAGTGTDPEGRPATGGDRLPYVEELARTGLGPAGPAVAAAVALLISGAALLVARRRR
ncbi:hypothetical protein ACIHIX_30615 [Streptomyces sp. NPDC051913]|uniref:hypothetical protein n=1 Tax=Streptomyces sp. NPDC051913 TaxID=3365676 RepID=UPI0037D3F5F0